ncbi:Fe-S cluster assembly protein SufD [Halovulum sp. GXIMD14793]
MALTETKLALAETLLSRHKAPTGKADWVKAARQAAAARLREMGGPARRDEYWKYTDPSLLSGETHSADPGSRGKPTLFDGVDRLHLVFVDGRFDAEQSSDLSQEGLTIEPLSVAASQDIHWSRDLYGKLEEAGQSPVPRPLAALNTAVADEGMLIRVTGQVARPIAIHAIHSADSADAAIHHTIRLESGAGLTLLEDGPIAARFNTVMEVDIADGASFNHIRTQGWDHDRVAATHVFARLGAESSFKSFTLTMNGVMTRNECVIELTGDDAIAHVAGASLGQGTFHHDDTVFITHDAVNCESRQVFKKVLGDGATGVFQGKILVREGAQKTDGYQISQGLLRDDDSQFLAKPELEIYADDVACSHGSTVGSVDEESLFYLCSRGVPRRDAEDMLVLAFLDEAIQEIEDDTLADLIRGQLQDWLAEKRQS